VRWLLEGMAVENKRDGLALECGREQFVLLHVMAFLGTCGGASGALAADARERKAVE